MPTSLPLCRALGLALAGTLALVRPSFAHAQASSPSAPFAPAPASTSTDPHPQIALRTLGWSLPFGKTGLDDGKLSALAAGAFPALLDLGIRVNHWLLAGVSFGFNYGRTSQALSDACAQAVHCKVSNFRIGLFAQIYPTSSGRLRPWFGYGAGYESLSVLVDVPSVAGGGESKGLSVTFGGIELAHLLAGVDYHASDTFAVGPFLGLGVGTYRTATFDTVNGLHQTTKLDDPALHGWLTAGLRFTLFP